MKELLKLVEQTKDFSAVNYRITFGWSGVFIEYLPLKKKIKLVP